MGSNGSAEGMFTSPDHRALLRWLLRELSTDNEDMIAFVDSIVEADDDDAQALLDELATPPPRTPTGALQTVYQDRRQIIRPREALRALNMPRASLYALLKRGTFPRPLLIEDQWVGWPREVVLDWADTSAGQRLAKCSHSGYAPFERYGTRRS